MRAQAARSVAEIVAGRASLAAFYRQWARMDSGDTGLLRTLVTDCLRWHHRLQWQLGKLLDKPLGRKDAELGALLRIGLLQLQFMRIPDHAAVDETVAATAQLRRRHARGLVNAVLRRFLRERDALEQELAANEPARLSHPEWFIAAVRADWSDRAEPLFAANNERPPQWLRINTQRIDPATYRAKLEHAGIAFTLDAELTAAVRLDEPVPSARLPGFGAGEVSLQDRAAQLAPDFLGLAAGQRVLDACAAPGGKTAAILERCAVLGEVVALDRSKSRIATLAANLQRLGLAATTICADALAVAQWWDERPFDRILLDAPCSATGVIRRHPDIKLRRSAGDVDNATASQRALLAALWPLLAVDGRLVYVTCSVLRCENDRQIVRFCELTPEAELIDARQYFPGEADGDGFYYACLKKRG